MIFFLSTRKNRFPMDRYLASWGRDLRHLIQPIDYETFLTFDEFVPGVYFFADLELLTAEQRGLAGAIWRRIDAQADSLLFNRPDRSLLRYDLLKRLHACGINTFNAYRPEEDLSGLRYPAFLRIENDHQGPRIASVADARELELVLDRLRAENELHRGWLITEFCDTSSADGVFRKYSAFLVNGEIIPRHLFFSRDWCLKKADLDEEAMIQEEREYLRTNPHREQIRNAFEVAGIEYGRIDYGWRDGGIEVWEINTNPMIASSRSSLQGSRLHVHESFTARMSKAIRQLAADSAVGRSRRNYPRQRASAAIHRLGTNPYARPMFRIWKGIKSLRGRLPTRSNPARGRPTHPRLEG